MSDSGFVMFEHDLVDRLTDLGILCEAAGILTFLQRKVNFETGEVSIELNEIARALRKSTRTIQRSLERLKKEKILETRITGRYLIIYFVGWVDPRFRRKTRPQGPADFSDGFGKKGSI